MPKPLACPECRGTGCDPEPLRAPADGSSYLFPRCALCRGRGILSPTEHEKYRRQKERRR